MRHSQLSKYVICTRTAIDHVAVYRERREHRVFRSLLHAVPGLEECLVNSSEEEVRLIADLVRLIQDCNGDSANCQLRSKRVPLVPDLTIRKPSRVLSSIGLRRVGNISILPLLRTSRSTGVSITNGLVPCCALPEWIGVTLSDSLSNKPCFNTAHKAQAQGSAT